MDEDGWQGIRGARPAKRSEAGSDRPDTAAGDQVSGQPAGTAEMLEPAPRIRHAWEEEADEHARRVASRRGGAVAAGLAGSPAAAFAASPQWTASLQVQRLLVIGMFACVAWAFSRGLVLAIAGGPRALSIFLLAILVFIAGIALGGRGEARHYRRYTDYGLTDWLLLLVPIVLILKLLPSLLQGLAAARAEIQSWTRDPASFGDAYLVWGLLLVLVVWDFSLRVAEDLNQLSFQPGEAPPAPNTPAYYDWLSSPYRFIDHSAAWRRLMQYFVFGGYGLLIFTGISIIPASELTNPNRPDVRGFVPSVLVYYLLGLVLASQTSLDRLRADWLRGGASVQPGLAPRWLGFGLALVIVAMLLALLLPTTVVTADDITAAPIVGILLWPIRMLFLAVNWVFSILAAILFAPVSWIMPAAGVVGGPSVPGGAPVPTPGPVEPAPAGGYPSLASRIVWSLLLYVLPAALALYAMWNTWKKRRAIGQGLVSMVRDVSSLFVGGILDLLAALWRLFSFGSPRLMRFAPEAIKARWRRRPRTDGREGGAAMGWLRLRGLGPRALIQYFYVSTAQRAEAVGWGRRRGQTAYEYSRDLARHMPDRRAELDTLTEAFVQAKYSPRPVDEDDARRARTPWERLRGTLQTRRRARQLGRWFGLAE